MDGLLQDLRYSIRLLVKRSSFTLVAVFTLAVGIGLNSSIFSVVNAVILRALPYKDSDRLIQVWERDTREGGEDHVVSPTNFFDWSKQSRSFERLSAFWLWMPELSTPDGTVKLAGSTVSRNFFETLGVTPQLGRTFRPEEELSDNRVVVVSYQFWQNHLGARPEAIGQPLRIDDSVYTVIGVLRPDYRHPESRWHWNESTELWRPLTLTHLGANRGNRFLRVIGRLKQDVTLKQAQAEMTTIASQLEKAYPETNTNWGANLIPLHEQFTGKFRSVLLLLQGAVGFVLLIACANLANLLLVRNAAREKEFATRAALGERRARMIRLLLTESLLLAGLGGIAGLFLAFLGVKLLSSFAPRDWTRLSDINVDNRVLGFTLFISLLTVLISGLAPALRAARVNFNESLSGARQAAQGHNARGFLVAAEIALALILLVGAGLLLRSLIRLQSVELGFNSENLMTAQITMPRSLRLEETKDNSQRMVNLYQQLLLRLGSLPGIQRAAITSSLPLGKLNDTRTEVKIEGIPPSDPTIPLMAGYRAISPNYFRTMGISLIKGRDFAEHDIKDSAQVAMINETFARLYLMNADPIGRKIIAGMGSQAPKEIVGVVADFRHAGLEIAPEPEMYVPIAQYPWSFVTLVARTTDKPEKLTTTAQNAVWAIDKNLSLERVMTMKQILSELVSRPRFNLLLLCLFSIVAVSLAAVGVYGVMSFMVTQNTREIGIRMALGAQTHDVLKYIIRQGMQWTIIGISLGLIAALGLTRLMVSFLYEVSVTDPLTLTGVTALLMGVALLACYIPARRATRVDPMVALRWE